MKILMRVNITFITLLCFSGCMQKVYPPTVEDNTFITYDIPKLMIKVSDELEYQQTSKDSISASNTFSSNMTKGVTVESFAFSNSSRSIGVTMLFERFTGPAGIWYMETPDYSSMPGIKKAGSITMNGKLYSTGILEKQEKYSNYLHKFYGRTTGADSDVRFQIIYSEKIKESFPTNETIEQFSARADKSFTILPYTAKAPPQSRQNEGMNEYIQHNLEKTEGTPCQNSLECAKGYFCTNGKCTKGFAD